MRARLLILVACISLITAAAIAHGDEQHVIGTVASVAKDSITVKTAANALVTVAVVPQTTFSKNKSAAKLSDLNVGDRVVVHAKELTEGKLVADTVQFSAPAAKPAPSAAK
jgi:exosome complex RNA-binding protein Rrp4